MSIFSGLSSFVSNMQPSQLFALAIFLAAISLVKTILKNALGVIVMVVGVMALLYFFVPTLYATVYSWMATGIHTLADKV